MPDFKDYSDDQLINQVIVLLEEIKERDLDLNLWKEVKDKDFFVQLTALTVLTSIVSDKELENLSATDFRDFISDKMDDWLIRHDIDVEKMKEDIEEQI